MVGFLKKILKSDKTLLVTAGILASLVMAGLYVVQPTVLRFLDYKIYDQLLRRQHTTKTSGVPVIVDIDEKSLGALGQWPWPRYRVALLLEKIRLAGAMSVGMDMVLAEPDRTSPALLRQQIGRPYRTDLMPAS